MVLADAWFFWTHTAMHRSHFLYRVAHMEHHFITSDLGVYGTAHACEFRIQSLHCGIVCASQDQLPFTYDLLCTETASKTALPCSSPSSFSTNPTPQTNPVARPSLPLAASLRHNAISCCFHEMLSFAAGALEFFLDWVGFHMLLVWALLQLPEWHPLEFGLALIPMGMVNTMGHCAHHLPFWLSGPLSFGILWLPYAQNPVTHFIHHVDPRFNRSLYFTWWDRLLGTYCKTNARVEGRK